MKPFIRSISLCALVLLSACGATGLPENSQGTTDGPGADSVAVIASERAQVGDFGAAMLLYRSVLESDPNHVPSLRGMEVIAAQSGDAVTTAHYYGRLQQIESLERDDVLILAGAERRAGDVESAVARLESGARRFGDDPHILAQLGLLLANMGRQGDARRYLELAIEASSGGERQAHRALGDLLFESGDYVAALPVLLSFQERYPGDFVTSMRAGYILDDSGEYDAAVIHYRAAIDARPSSVDARVGLARAYEGMGDVDKAIRAYDRAIRQRGTVREVEPVILAQSNLLNRKGRFDRTIELLEQARSSFELSAGLECALGMALAGEGHYDDAIVAFESATSDRQYGDFARSQIRRLERLQR